MKTNYFLFLFFMLIGLGLNAQTVSITVTDEGKAMAYHNVTVSHGDYVLGTGQTNSQGFVSIYTPNLRGKSVDVAGKYQNGGTKKEWSIKGKLKLDQNYGLHIRLEEMGKEMEASRKEMEQRRKEMSERMRNRTSNRKSIFDDNDDDDNNGQKKIPNNNNQTPKPNTNNNNNPKKLPKANTDANNQNGNFEAGLTKIKDTFSSFDKKDIALELVKSNQLTTNQIKEVLSEINSAFSKKEIAIAAYANCTDKNNYENVINTLSSSFLKEDVRKATIDK